MLALAILLVCVDNIRKLNSSLIYNRNADRLIHIPFFQIDNSTHNERRQLEDQLKRCCEEASSSVGVLIGFGEKLKLESIKEKIEEYMPLVKNVLPDVPYRLLKSYALILTINELVCM